MNSIDFGGHRSEVKVTMGTIYKCEVRGDATLCAIGYLGPFRRELVLGLPV